MKCNGIRHLKTAPYHPASNGLAERAVQTVKSGIRHMAGGDLESKVVLFLDRYRVTPQSSSSLCHQTVCFRCYVHLYPISLNLRRSSNVQGCVKREHRNICAVFSSSSPHMLCLIADDTDVFILFIHHYLEPQLTNFMVMESLIHGRSVIDICSTVKNKLQIAHDLLACHVRM